MHSILSFRVLAVWLALARAAWGATSYAPMPVPSDIPVPAKRTIDSLGNRYSFTNDTLIKTTPAGVSTVMAYAEGADPSAPLSAPNYKFTDVVVDAADTVYAAETNWLPGGNAIGEVILMLPATGSSSLVEIPLREGISLRPNCEVAVDDHGGLYSIAPDYSVIKIAADGTYEVLINASAFLPPTGHAGIGDLSVDAAGHIVVFGHIYRTNYFGPLLLVPLSSVPTITFQPTGRTVVQGTSDNFLSVIAAATPEAGSISYQWFLDSAPLPGATGESLRVTLPGTYTVVVSTNVGSVRSEPALVVLTTPGGIPVLPQPSITQQPMASELVYGSSTMLTLGAVSTLPISYRWQRNGVDIPGATDSVLTVTTAGVYTAILTTTAGTVTTEPATVLISNRLVNISSRASVGTGEGICIAGFIVHGDASTAKSVLVRAVGPGLAQFGVTPYLARPVLSVFNDAGRLIASNAGWSDAPEVTEATAHVHAFPFQTGSMDAALVLTLPPGGYTAQIAGAGQTTGIALVEVYELDADLDHFINISTRAQVGSGAATLIGGFVAGGNKPAKVLIRAVGPGLAAFGLSNVVQKPILTVYNAAGQLIASNQGWTRGSSNDAVAVAAAITAVHAFPLAADQVASAVVLTLAPGAYTAHILDADGAGGNALLEVYQVPE